MKSLVGVLLGLVVGIGGFVINLDPAKQYRIDHATLIQRQKAVFDLLDNVCEESTDVNVLHFSKEFSIEKLFTDDDVLEKFFGEHKDVVLKFKEIYGDHGEGLTTKEDAFYEFNTLKRDEMKAVYGLFYHAKDFDSFYRLVVWARNNLNCELFVNVFYAALMNRQDTNMLSIPAPYEILPHYFIHRDGLIKAILLNRNKDFTYEDDDGINLVGNVLTVDTNYTGSFFENQDESKLAYFREDVGLNSFYYFTMLRKATWVKEVNGDKINNLGDFWYYITRQLNARYNLERITNGLKPVEGITWTNPLNTQYEYDPYLINRNGTYFPTRNNVIVDKSDAIAQLSKLKSYFDTSYSNMKVDKTTRMNTVVDFLTSGSDHYDFLARSTLGKNELDDDFVSRSPSALQHYATTLRDPVFWRLNKHYLDLFNQALNGLEPYAHNQLYFPGVEIINVVVKKMQTFYDYNELEITNSIKQDTDGKDYKIYIGQPRLNHKPFSILINVSSLVSQKAIVKIFIGPKFDPADIAANKDFLKQLDTFDYYLKVGNNVIVRKSDDIDKIAEDFVNFDDLYKQMEAVKSGIEPFTMKKIEDLVGFPSRSVLPKGTPEGFPLQLYVIIAPFLRTTNDGLYDVNSEIMSLSYPFDRPIENSKFFVLSNTMFKDVIITHKGENKVYDYGGEGTSKKWYSSEKKKDITKTKKPFDYKSKKESGSYGKKSGTFDYSSKKEKYEPKNYDSINKYESTPETEYLNVIPQEPTESIKVIPIHLPVTQKYDLDEEKRGYFGRDGNDLDYADDYTGGYNLNLQSKSPFKPDTKKVKNIKDDNLKMKKSDEKYGSFEMKKGKDNKFGVFDEEKGTDDKKFKKQIDMKDNSVKIKKSEDKYGSFEKKKEKENNFDILNGKTYKKKIDMKDDKKVDGTTKYTSEKKFETSDKDFKTDKTIFKNKLTEKDQSFENDSIDKSKKLINDKIKFEKTKNKVVDANPKIKKYVNIDSGEEKFGKKLDEDAEKAKHVIISDKYGDSEENKKFSKKISPTGEEIVVYNDFPGKPFFLHDNEQLEIQKDKSPLENLFYHTEKENNLRIPNPLNKSVKVGTKMDGVSKGVEIENVKDNFSLDNKKNKVVDIEGFGKTIHVDDTKGLNSEVKKFVDINPMFYVPNKTVKTTVNKYESNDANTKQITKNEDVSKEFGKTVDTKFGNIKKTTKIEKGLNLKGTFGENYSPLYYFNGDAMTYDDFVDYYGDKRVYI